MCLHRNTFTTNRHGRANTQLVHRRHCGEEDRLTQLVKHNIFADMAFTDLTPGPNNLDLERERAQCSFNIEEFAQWWYGGVDKLRVKRDRGERTPSFAKQLYTFSASHCNISVFIIYRS